MWNWIALWSSYLSRWKEDKEKAIVLWVCRSFILDFWVQAPQAVTSCLSEMTIIHSTCWLNLPAVELYPERKERRKFRKTRGDFLCCLGPHSGRTTPNHQKGTSSNFKGKQGVEVTIDQVDSVFKGILFFRFFLERNFYTKSRFFNSCENFSFGIKITFLFLDFKNGIVVYEEIILQIKGNLSREINRFTCSR